MSTLPTCACKLGDDPDTGRYVTTVRGIGYRMGTRMTTTHSPSSTGLATRLLAGQAIVLVAGALTVGLVAAVIGPRSSTSTFSKPDTSRTPRARAHRDGLPRLIPHLRWDRSAHLAARRRRRHLVPHPPTAPPLEQVTHAARELTLGHYATRVPAIAAGTELETLGAAFNTMAARLDSVEDTRRRMLSDLAHELRTPSPPSARTTKASTTA